MRVRIVSDISDHVRLYPSGDIADLPDDQAARWIALGLAVSVAPETAALDAGPERATLPAGRKRPA